MPAISTSFATLLIVAAVGTYVAGFLFRDQVQIRALVVIGSILYCIYYAIAADEPLWDAFLGTVLIGLASFQGLVFILWSRTRAAAPRHLRHVLDVMGQIEPGLFRQLMRVAKHYTAEEPVVLVREGVAPDTLWFVASGALDLDREGQARVRFGGPCFVGEIAWLRGGTASATVTARPGAELVRWQRADLARAVRKSQRLELALDAVIAQDLAHKVARSTPLASGATAIIPDPASADPVDGALPGRDSR